ncbi:MAG TPA: hypothetical protein VFY29_03605 [Terriglobia bacterium]|nr:hypothetical protein [Terriglobia bacterium]
MPIAVFHLMFPSDTPYALERVIRRIRFTGSRPLPKDVSTKMSLSANCATITPDDRTAEFGSAPADGIHRPNG